MFAEEETFLSCKANMIKNLYKGSIGYTGADLPSKIREYGGIVMTLHLGCDCNNCPHFSRIYGTNTLFSKLHILFGIVDDWLTFNPISWPY